MFVGGEVCNILHLLSHPLDISRIRKNLQNIISSWTPPNKISLGASITHILLYFHYEKRYF